MMLFASTFLTTCDSFSICGFKHSNVLLSTSGREKLQCFKPFHLKTTESSDVDGESYRKEEGFDLGAWFNPNTRGGVLVWSGLLTLVPLGVYNYFGKYSDANLFISC